MLNIASIVIGLFALPLVFFAFLPFFGWALWLILPLPAFGLLIGAMSTHTTGKKLNAVLLGLGVLRLLLGGGFF